MALDARTISELADCLLAAEETRTPIEVPSITYPGMIVVDGYAVQRAIIARKVARGDRVVGKKVGLTSKANQDVFNVHEPVYGQLLASGVHPEHMPVHTARLIQPIIECEITFVMRRRLAGPGVTVPDVIRATEGIMPSLELGDARMRAWIGRAQASDIVADSCGSAGLIVGGEIHTLKNFDLRYTGMVVEKNGEILSTGAIGAVLGNPAQAVAWLTNKLAEVELALEEGDVVLSGALTGAVQMTAGDILTATFGGGLGAVAVKFV